jgi:hypothetical protein
VSTPPKHHVLRGNTLGGQTLGQTSRLDRSDHLIGEDKKHPDRLTLREASGKKGKVRKLFLKLKRKLRFLGPIDVT